MRPAILCETFCMCWKADTKSATAAAGAFSDSGHAQSRFPCSKLKLGALQLRVQSLGRRSLAVPGARTDSICSLCR